MEELTKLIKESIANVVDVEANEVELAQDLEGEYGVDSIEMVEILAVLKSHYNLDLDVTTLTKLKNGQEILDKFTALVDTKS